MIKRDKVLVDSAEFFHIYISSSGNQVSAGLCFGPLISRDINDQNVSLYLLCLAPVPVIFHRLISVRGGTGESENGTVSAFHVQHIYIQGQTLYTLGLMQAV